MGMINLPDNSRVYADAQTLIYTVERRPRYIQVCDSIWQLLVEGRTSVSTSELSLLECIVLPLREGDSAAVDRFEQFLAQPAIWLLPVSRDVLRSAARIRAAKTRIKTPDAIHLASASAANCDRIVTNDRAWVGATDVGILLLDDLIAADS